LCKKVIGFVVGSYAFKLNLRENIRNSQWNSDKFVCHTFVAYLSDISWFGDANIWPTWNWTGIRYFPFQSTVTSTMKCHT
jgi:hypothetical protein